MCPAVGLSFSGWCSPAAPTAAQQPGLGPAAWSSGMAAHLCVCSLLSHRTSTSRRLTKKRCIFATSISFVTCICRQRTTQVSVRESAVPPGEDRRRVSTAGRDGTAGACQTLAACWGLAAPHLTPSPRLLGNVVEKANRTPTCASCHVLCLLQSPYLLSRPLPTPPHPPASWVTSGFCCSRFERPEPCPSSRRPF